MALQEGQPHALSIPPDLQTTYGPMVDTVGYHAYRSLIAIEDIDADHAFLRKGQRRQSRRVGADRGQMDRPNARMAGVTTRREVVCGGVMLFHSVLLNTCL